MLGETVWRILGTSTTCSDCYQENSTKTNRRFQKLTMVRYDLLINFELKSDFVHLVGLHHRVGLRDGVSPDRLIIESATMFVGVAMRRTK